MRTFRAVSVLALFAVLGLGPTAAQADLFELTDDNSIARIETESQSGLSFWSVDGVDHMFQEWFWGRVDGGDNEVSIDSLPLLHQELHGTNQLHVIYGAEGVTLDLLYTLQGGPAGSEVSTLDEVLTIYNGTDSRFTLNVFAYTDFDLNGTIGGDTATFNGTDTLTQVDGTFTATVTALGPTPSHWQISEFSDIRNDLNDGSATTLSDSGSPFGPGDATHAFQFSLDLVPFDQSGQQIHLVKNIHCEQPIIPEPGTMILMGLGGLAAGWVGRRKRVI